jgi:ferric-dicitrate binding protein FerR (iron transport regulator)
MEISEELIKKFFEKRCTSEEAQLVSRYLTEHPHVLDKHMSEAEWNETAPPATEDENIYVAAWIGIQKEQRRTTVLRRIRITAAAACIALLIGWGYFQLRPGSRSTAVRPAEEPTAVVRTVVNTSDSILHFVLPDGSVAGLSPGSRLLYASAFQQRAVSLEGEATFKVAKDRLRPFTVSGNVLTVTALGTFFSMKNTGAGDAAVKLYEGKVLVEKIRKDKGLSEAYLQPGMALLYNGSTMTMKVSLFEKNMGRVVARNRPAPSSHTMPSVHGAYTFNNQPVADVFRTLEVLYDVQIQYRPRDMDSLYFIARFDNRDSVGDILKTIGLLNDLKVVEKTEGRYQITKKR